MASTPGYSNFVYRPSFVLPAGATTTTTATTAAPTVVAAAPAPVYYGGAPAFGSISRSYYTPTVVPVAATTTTTTTEATTTATTAAPTVVAAAPAPVYYGGAPAFGSISRSYYTSAAVPTTTATTTVAPVATSYVGGYTGLSTTGTTTRYAGSLTPANNVVQHIVFSNEKKPVAAAAVAAPEPAQAIERISAGQQLNKFVNLTVTVVSAGNLPSRFTDKTDPYVKVTIDKTSYTTSTKSDAGKTAFWNESFTFRNVPYEGVAIVEVYDKDVLTKDDLLGSGYFTFEAGKKTVDLKNKDKSTGFVEFNVSVH